MSECLWGQINEDGETCDNRATHWNCDLRHADGSPNVCEKHKCRCAQKGEPLDALQIITRDRDEWKHGTIESIEAETTARIVTLIRRRFGPISDVETPSLARLVDAIERGDWKE